MSDITILELSNKLMATAEAHSLEYEKLLDEVREKTAKLSGESSDDYTDCAKVLLSVEFIFFRLRLLLVEEYAIVKRLITMPKSFYGQTLDMSTISFLQKREGYLLSCIQRLNEIKAETEVIQKLLYTGGIKSFL